MRGQSNKLKQEAVTDVGLRYLLLKVIVAAIVGFVCLEIVKAICNTCLQVFT